MRLLCTFFSVLFYVASCRIRCHCDEHKRKPPKMDTVPQQLSSERGEFSNYNKIKYQILDKHKQTIGWYGN